MEIDDKLAKKEKRRYRLAIAGLVLVLVVPAMFLLSAILGVVGIGAMWLLPIMILANMVVIYIGTVFLVITVIFFARYRKEFTSMRGLWVSIIGLAIAIAQFAYSTYIYLVVSVL